MNLNQHIATLYNKNIITKFESTYPEVVNFFNGEYFESLFEHKTKVSLRADYWDSRHWSPVCVEGLPFRDSNGVVDRGDIAKYLTAQGFNVSFIVQDGHRCIEYLEISLVM